MSYDQIRNELKPRVRIAVLVLCLMVIAWLCFLIATMPPEPPDALPIKQYRESLYVAGKDTFPMERLFWIKGKLKTDTDSVPYYKY